MKYWIFGCLLLGIIMVTSPAGAQIPDQVSITGSTAWLVAGSGESATITVEVQNGGTPLSGLDVAFSVDAAYGSITPAGGVTGPDGRATATFIPGTLSGDAPITVEVTYNDGETTGTVEEVYLQQIDHAAPYTLAGLEYAAEATVGEEMDITVRLADRYGNPIDNRNTAESVIFSVGSAGGTAGFINGGECETPITVAVDGAGNAIATLRVDQHAGENIIVIDSPGPIIDKYISIFGVANGTPASISYVMSPSTGSPPYVPADGESTFSFTYTLFDRYGNPTQGQQVWVNTTVGGENRLLTTSSSGQVSIAYGPKDTTGKVTITATAVANASVTASREVEFTSTDPVNMLLTASPQTMPSRDAKPDSVAFVRAKVMDIKGNPVFGETVEFAIENIVYGASSLVEDPYFIASDQQTASALTDGNGYATVPFYPGSFTTDRDDPAWNGTATGTCTIRAEWGNVSRTMTVSWKNYPYLSVETSVEPETVEVNGTIDATVRLRGDGWALQPDPIDVVLVIDRSGSMGYTDVSPSRIAAAKSAASTFVDQMSSERDRVGLVSFSSSTTRDDDITSSFETVKADINDLWPNGATQLRRAIYEAILMEQEQGRSEAVKAVVVLTDGDWNYDGSPIGHGTGYPESSSWAYTFSGSSLEPNNYRYYDGLGGTLQTGSRYYNPWGRYRNYQYCTDGEWTNQNMSRFASANGVKLYAITFAYNPSTTVRDTMRVLANATGGFYEHATDGYQLTDIYQRIAGELKVEAGVNTTMDVSFENVEVNGTFVSGDDVFDYVYAPDISTRIYSFNDTVDIIPEYTRDDTSAWAASRTLHFDVGTVRLNQTWETTFRLQVLADGNINVFGPGSTITFNDGTDTLDLPDLFVTAIPELNDTGVEVASLDIDNLRCTGSEPYLDFLPLAWDVAYTGAHEVTEDIYCQIDGVSWIYLDSQTADNVTSIDTCQIDVRHLPPGNYSVRVKATAPDAPADEVTLDTAVWIGQRDRPYIQIR